MKPNALLLIALLSATTVGCSSTPKVEPIDNALLARAPLAGRTLVTEARTARDAAADAYAVARADTQRAKEEVALARAALKTIRSQLDESKLAVQVAASGSAAQLEQAQSAHAFALARADLARERLALRKRELEFASLEEKLMLEMHRLSLAKLELTKAEALQGVDLVAAQKIPIKDYRKQVAYHREEVEAMRKRVGTAGARLDEARGNFDDMERALQRIARENY